jgi:hypothetical protein
MNQIETNKSIAVTRTSRTVIRLSHLSLGLIKIRFKSKFILNINIAII